MSQQDLSSFLIDSILSGQTKSIISMESKYSNLAKKIRKLGLSSWLLLGLTAMAVVLDQNGILLTDVQKLD